MRSITREELERQIANEKPSEDRRGGYALVDVLDHKSFVQEHIPGSINIPKGDEGEFERRFDKSKEIIVYCGSAQCPASETVAERLAKKGFRNVVRYEGGIVDWKQGQNMMERGEVSMHAQV